MGVDSKNLIFDLIKDDSIFECKKVEDLIIINIIKYSLIACKNPFLNIFLVVFMKNCKKIIKKKLLRNSNKTKIENLSSMFILFPNKRSVELFTLSLQSLSQYEPNVPIVLEKQMDKMNNPT